VEAALQADHAAGEQGTAQVQSDANEIWIHRA
jgi:hypothetical protein